MRFSSAQEAVDWYFWSTVSVPSKGAERHAEVEGPYAGAKSVLPALPPRSAPCDDDLIMRAEIGAALSQLSDLQWRIVISVCAFGAPEATLCAEHQIGTKRLHTEWVAGITKVARLLIGKGVIQ